MKKYVVAILTLIMLVAVSVTASADITATTFRLTVPTQAIADDQLYNYHSDSYVWEEVGDHTVHVRHEVTQIDADETNRIAAYCLESGMTMGAKWHSANYRFYPITSNAIEEHDHFSVAARGNTNYATKYSLNSITLVGSIDALYD